MNPVNNYFLLHTWRFKLNNNFPSHYVHVHLLLIFYTYILFHHFLVTFILFSNIYYTKQVQSRSTVQWRNLNFLFFLFSISCRYLSQLLSEDSVMEKMSAQPAHQVQLVQSWFRCAVYLPSNSLQLTSVNRSDNFNYRKDVCMHVCVYEINMLYIALKFGSLGQLFTGLLQATDMKKYNILKRLIDKKIQKC